METNGPGTDPASAGIDWSLLGPLLVQAGLLQLGTQLARVNTTYAAIQIELPVVWIGVITASYALFPAIFALQIGRFMDRRGDVTAFVVGTVFSVAGCIGFWLFDPALAPLIVSTTLLGLGQTFCMTGQQSFSARCAGPHLRDSVFGYYMLALSIGQAGGPLLLGYLAAGASIPPTGTVFFWTMITAIVAMSLAVILFRRIGGGAAKNPKPPMPLGELIKVRGLFAMAMASALVVTAMDLTVVYLPLVGAERGIDATVIGYILTTRAAGSICARIFYASLVKWLGRLRLMFLVMTGATVALITVALPVPVWLLWAAVSFTGFALGIAITASLTTLVDIAPQESRGAALAIRQTCNRLGQFFTPMIVSVVAAATGAGGIFVVTALAIGVSGLAADRAVRQRQAV